MKAGAAGFNGALAVLGLVAAYATWQRPKESVDNQNVTVLEASKGSLSKVRYEDGARWMEVYRVEGDKSPWLTQATFPIKPELLDTPWTPDGGVDAGVVKIVQLPPAPPRQIRGNDRAETLLSRFTPLEASRALGKLSAEKQKELGLEGSAKKLTVTVTGVAHVFTVNNPQPGQIGNYLRDDADGAIYLLSGSLISELEPASQALVDRRLHAFRPVEFDEFVVTADGKTAAFVQKDAEIPQTMKVAPKESPDKPDALVHNWHDKVINRLIITEVLGKGESPKGGEPKIEVRVDYLARGANKGFLELGKIGAELWARSENTASWVGLHAGTDDLISEAKKFTAGK